MMYESAVEEKKDEIKYEQNDSCYRLATVTSIFEDGFSPKLTFVGEQTESNKKFSYLYSYKPAINDMVLLAKTDSTFIILGKVAYDIAPDKGTTEEDIISIITSQLLLNKVVKLNSNDVININTAGNYNFFRLLSTNHFQTEKFAMDNKSPIGSQSISSLSTSADLATVISRVNTLISRLKSFGFLYEL